VYIWGLGAIYGPRVRWNGPVSVLDNTPVVWYSRAAAGASGVFKDTAIVTDARYAHDGDPYMAAQSLKEADGQTLRWLRLDVDHAPGNASVQRQAEWSAKVLDIIRELGGRADRASLAAKLNVDPESGPLGRDGREPERQDRGRQCERHSHCPVRRGTSVHAQRPQTRRGPRNQSASNTPRTARPETRSVPPLNGARLTDLSVWTASSGEDADEPRSGAAKQCTTRPSQPRHGRAVEKSTRRSPEHRGGRE